MFNIFKSHKKSAKGKHTKAQPLFECLGADMHCHLLPGVDDGSKSDVESATCLKVMQDAGFNEVYLTPHYYTYKYNNKEDDILRRFDVFKKAMEQYPTPKLCGVSGEYRYDDGFMPRLKNPGDFLLIANKYLLTELSLHAPFAGYEEAIFDLQSMDEMRDTEIILAHPERYAFYSTKCDELEHLKNMGVYFQVNILSLIGFYGEDCQEKGYELIEKGWVEFLGTDLHTTLYAQALIDSTYDKKLEKMLGKHTFLNNQITNPKPIERKTI